MSSNVKLPRLAYVGRSADRESLRDALNQARRGEGGPVFLVGEGGVGKTRLAEIMSEEAARDGFTVALGRAYLAESGVPYALFSDALLPLLRTLDSSALTTLTRGGLDNLAYLFPGLGSDVTVRHPAVIQDPAEFKTRLFWTFAEFLKGLAHRAPLLLVFDDLHWADASSLELLHFLARHTRGQPIAIICIYNEAEREGCPPLRTLEKSLAGLGISRTRRLEPLTLEATRELIEQTFQAPASVVDGFATRLFDWTGGNPFFIQETLLSLVTTQRLHERDGTWLGWEIQDLEVPATVRDAITARLAGLSDEARRLAELASVIDMRFDLDVIRAVWRGDDAKLIVALDELRRGRILNERAEGGGVSYDFAQPMFRQALYAELGIARAKLLHGEVAAALECHHQANALEHADELAYHYSRAEVRATAPKAVTYLAAAGERALARLANREAADYLSLALDLASYGGERTVAESVESAIVENLARARQRLGEFDAAVKLFARAREKAERDGDLASVARQHRRIGLSYYWSSRQAEALAHFDRGLEAVRRTTDDALHIRLLLARGSCLMDLGRATDARSDIERALALAETLGDTQARAQALRALLLLHTWCGPPALAREYGQSAIALAREIGALDVLFMSHWTLGVLEGLTGHTGVMAEHVQSAERVARTLRSPMLELWTSELIIEYAFAVGDWETGLARGEQAIATARTLNQRQILPRLLVWTAIIYLGRGDLERAREMVDEAWAVSGADDSTRRTDVHTVVPAHIGLASYHLARWEFDEAIRVARAGLEIADQSGYTFWALHRLLPIIAEAYCHQNDLEGASRIEQRLSQESARLDHKLGLAWARACRALIVWRSGDSERGARLMAEAAEALEAIPMLPDAARLRRHMAARLVEIGDPAEALRELRRVHAVFLRLGAEFELGKTREQIRELGARLPVLAAGAGADGLTGRELAIARLVAQRKSNKSIGGALDISPRTVSTHLSSVFRKLGVSSRAELADHVRVHGLIDADVKAKP